MKIKISELLKRLEKEHGKNVTFRLHSDGSGAIVVKDAGDDGYLTLTSFSKSSMDEAIINLWKSLEEPNPFEVTL